MRALMLCLGMALYFSSVFFGGDLATVGWMAGLMMGYALSDS